MNKKLSTILFVLGGTLVNIILMILFISGLLFGTSAILRGLGYEPGHTIYIPFLVGAIFGGMVLAFIVYSKITKFVQKKYELEKYLEPLFKTRR
jgi:hypothetical protein